MCPFKKTIAEPLHYSMLTSDTPKKIGGALDNSSMSSLDLIGLEDFHSMEGKENKFGFTILFIILWVKIILTKVLTFLKNIVYIINLFR